MLIRWLKALAGIVILALLSWYLAIHWYELKPILRLSPLNLTLLYTISVAGIYIGALAQKILFRALGVKTHLWDMFVLLNVTYLLSYVPMKFGTFFKASYLKTHYNLSYAHFGVSVMYLTLIMTLITPLVGAALLLTVYDIKTWEAQLLLLVFVISMLASFLLLFAPIPMPKGENRISKILRNFLQGRKSVMKDKKTLFESALLMNTSFILSSARIGIVYNCLGQHLSPAGFLILGTVGYVLIFINITPGSIGIREVALGAVASVLGVPLSIGMSAALIDRAIALSYSFIVGGICTIMLWRKAPDDFKKPLPQQS